MYVCVCIYKKPNLKKNRSAQFIIIPGWLLWRSDAPAAAQPHSVESSGGVSQNLSPE